MKKLFLLVVILLINFSYTLAQKVVIGYVIKIENNLLYFDRGKIDNVGIGDEFTLLRDMPEGQANKKIGIVEVTQVFDKMSVGRIKNVVSGEKPSVLDKIEIAPIIDIPNELKKLKQRDDFLSPIIKHNPVKIAPNGQDIDIIVRAHAYQDLKGVFLTH